MAQHRLTAQHAENIKAAVLGARQGPGQEAGVSEGALVGTDQLLCDAAPGDKAVKAFPCGEEKVTLAVLPENVFTAGALLRLGGGCQLLPQDICQLFLLTFPKPGAEVAAQKVGVLPGAHAPHVRPDPQLIQVFAEGPGIRVHLSQIVKGKEDHELSAVRKVRPA